ncbi:hypothetical protein CSUI_003348 [Cystoisospora suis]|uniref:C3H1-type domain-containing protein n=1 Tax=Cystoisospora suis TaxID=483139 RepID=A0A2C6L4M2_9APIC|nr:hypothetical protein CSUI_003348 [Cystoisospora suis]
MRDFYPSSYSSSSSSSSTEELREKIAALARVLHRENVKSLHKRDRQLSSSSSSSSYLSVPSSSSSSISSFHSSQYLPHCQGGEGGGRDGRQSLLGSSSLQASSFYGSRYAREAYAEEVSSSSSQSSGFDSFPERKRMKNLPNVQELTRNLSSSSSSSSSSLPKGACSSSAFSLSRSHVLSTTRYPTPPSASSCLNPSSSSSLSASSFLVGGKEAGDSSQVKKAFPSQKDSNQIMKRDVTRKEEEKKKKDELEEQGEKDYDHGNVASLETTKKLRETSSSSRSQSTHLERKEISLPCRSSSTSRLRDLKENIAKLQLLVNRQKEKEQLICERIASKQKFLTLQAQNPKGWNKLVNSHSSSHSSSHPSSSLSSSSSFSSSSSSHSSSFPSSSSAGYHWHPRGEDSYLASHSPYLSPSPASSSFSSSFSFREEDFLFQRGEEEEENVKAGDLDEQDDEEFLAQVFKEMKEKKQKEQEKKEEKEISTFLSSSSSSASSSSSYPPDLVPRFTNKSLKVCRFYSSRGGYCRNGDSCPYFHDKTLHPLPSQTKDHLYRKKRSSESSFSSKEGDEEEERKTKRKKKIQERGEASCNGDHDEDDVSGSVNL